jgi:hypothetical protein
MVIKKFKISLSLFLAYPANQDYYLDYFFSWEKKFDNWRPRFGAIIKQERGKWILMYIIPCQEKDIKDASENDFKLLVNRLEKKSILLQAQSRITYSGILEGLLSKKGLLNRNVTADITSQIIIQAKEKLFTDNLISEKIVNNPKDYSVILLGGRGYIGVHLKELLPDFHCIDQGDSFPEHLKGKNAILINLAPQGTFTSRANELWPEMIVLNESYPGPNIRELAIFKSKSIKIFHIKGVEPEFVFPKFTRDYYGATPCCSIQPSDNFKVIITELLKRN